jgi:hypothetical protein
VQGVILQYVEESHPFMVSQLGLVRGFDDRPAVDLAGRSPREMSKVMERQLHERELPGSNSPAWTLPRVMLHLSAIMEQEQSNHRVTLLKIP